MRKSKTKSPIKDEYRRARAALLRRINRAKNKGMDVSKFEIPKIPKKITRGSINKIKKASQKFTEYKKAIPKYGDQMADLVDAMIRTAQNWIDDSPLSTMKLAAEARIQHRGDEARQKFDQYLLSFDKVNRKKLQYNVIATWDELVSRLERFLLESDQYHYDGDLSELADIFVQMLKPVLPYNMPEYSEGAEDMVSEFVADHDWIDIEED